MTLPTSSDEVEQLLKEEIDREIQRVQPIDIVVPSRLIQSD